MKLKKIKLVRGDDWMGLYIDKKLVYEGHDISEKMLLELCGIEFHSFEVNQEWMEDKGHLPEDFFSIPKSKLRINE